MEYNKIQNKLQDFINFYERSGDDSIKWNEYSRLENVYKNNSLARDFRERAEYLHEWMHNIGKEVYKSDKNFNYAVVDTFADLDTWNMRYFNIEESFIFTEELFNELCINYIQYQIDRLSEELIERQIVCNSTSKITNLIFEWDLECKQELIKMFKKLLEL